MKEDIKCPEESHLDEVKKTIVRITEEGKKECFVTVQKWGDREQAVNAREGADM